MVVVSGSWVKNVATYPIPPIDNDMVIPMESQAMAAKAILICRPNSHHFNERTLILDQPVKVGRSVGRIKPSTSNAIFDCKVLSRHHALLWYEDGKFFLQDTKSSNGTFVNNNRLAAESENHELSSGDIVQFGVDVVENNRKVTHGCIVATLKLYLPDGKEAKASPSVTEADRHGVVPLDELYRLNQIIQEANQREQCLETKLTALQHVVEETRKSAEESWQVYAGEERLLSRISALENQLQQASKGWGEDKLREELCKLQVGAEAYQVAAKDTLKKLHTEWLEAVAVATEQERARISAEQEALFAKEQLTQAQLELEEVAQKLTELQKQCEEAKVAQEAKEKDLEAKLMAESSRVLDLQLQLHQLNSVSMNLEQIEKSTNYFEDDLKNKEDLIAENEADEKTNGVQNNHITFTMGPVEENSKDLEQKEKQAKSETIDPEETVAEIEEKNEKHVSFKLPDEAGDKPLRETVQNGSEDSDSNAESTEDSIDSKTLKYQYQSVQNELRRKIELLENLASANKEKISALDKALTKEAELSKSRLEENDSLKEDFGILEQKYKECCNESLQLKDKVNNLSCELESAHVKLKELSEVAVTEKLDREVSCASLIDESHLLNVEEELVSIKEKYRQLSDEKLKLHQDFVSLKEKYLMLCNKSHNINFFYIAPLILIIAYLLISAMVS